MNGTVESGTGTMVEDLQAEHRGRLASVLRRKVRIYGWLLVGLVPVWACGLAERFLESKGIWELWGLLAGVPFVASFWIVVARYETIEQRKLPARVRMLLLLVSMLVAVAAIGGIIMAWAKRGL